MSDFVTVTVPLQNEPLEPPPAARVRALKRHLVESLRDPLVTTRPDRLVQKPTPEPAGFSAKVLGAGCATCRGYCCTGGGDHAYIDSRTMARVRRDNPGIGERALIRLFLARLAPRSYRGSCLFHGPDGCSLGRALRAELCNAYYCNGLKAFLKHEQPPDRVQILATRCGQERRSAVIERRDREYRGTENPGSP